MQTTSSSIPILVLKEQNRGRNDVGVVKKKTHEAEMKEVEIRVCKKRGWE